MPPGTHAWGSIPFPGLADPDAMPTPQAPGNPAAESTDYLHRIAEKYDGQPVEDVTPFLLAAGQFIKRDFSQTPFSSLVVSVNAGSVEVFFGDYTSPSYADAVGHFTVPSGGAPWQGLFATMGRIVTVRNRSSAALTAPGCLTIARP